ncbi:hypothetical protein MBLNU459_g8321t1 [Dothideomycetes sp. NU459]
MMLTVVANISDDKATRQSTRDGMKPDCKNKNDGDLNFQIDRAIRLWLMVFCQTNIPGAYPWGWKDDETIGSFLDRRLQTKRFTSPDQQSDNGITRIPRRFTAENLEWYKGMKMEWTNHLNQHLEIDDDVRSFKVFPHKRWLLAMIENIKDDNDDKPYYPLPLALLEETVRTIDLLFPPWDGRTARYLQRKNTPQFPTEDLLALCSSGASAGAGAGARSLRLSDFGGWADRLADLAVEFESPPHSLRTMWRDTRNTNAHLTFAVSVVGIAVMTFLFGTVAVVLAGLTWRTAAHPPDDTAAAAAATAAA